MPDHGEFDPPAAPVTNKIDMAKSFPGYYQDEGKKEYFDAAMTMLEKAYRDAFAPQRVMGLATLIESSAAPQAAVTPHFSDVAQPGQVVKIEVAPTPANALPRPDELDE